jgi:hypothetical protein
MKPQLVTVNQSMALLLPVKPLQWKIARKSTATVDVERLYDYLLFF